MSVLHSDLEVISTAADWLQHQHQVHLVTVVKTWGSSPRPVGSLAAVRDDGVLIGSVSGGCVEKQLSEQILKGASSGEFATDSATNTTANSVRRSASAPQISNATETTNGAIISHHIDDEQARRYGLSCGGELELVFELIDNSDALTRLMQHIAKRERVVRTVDTTTGDITITPATPSQRFEFNGTTLHKVFGPDWRLLLIGAGQLSRFTAEFALALDYEVIVCEPRPGFREAWKVEGTTLIDMSPDDAVLEFANDQQSAVLALTHDPNVDDMALMEALPGKAFYVGALGSRTNYEKRKKRLLAIGLEKDEIERLHGPVGLDIGSRTSAEIAISIVAHLIKERSAIGSTVA